MIGPDEWIEEVAAVLNVAPVIVPTDLLDLTREIAHGVQRACGPLTLLCSDKLLVLGEMSKN